MLTLPLLALLTLAGDLPGSSPLAPAEALRSFRIVEGYRIELAAAEPLVVSPVAMAFDPEGCMYVVEMRDYPFTRDPDNLTTSPEADSQPSGRIRLLEDVDGDGRVDRSVVFADGLHWPTGLALHDGGVLAAAAPDILYLRDGDGDGVADLRRVVWTGFGRKNVQALLNNLKWSLDNRLYGAGGGNEGSVVPGGDPSARPVAIRGRDFRFSPAGGPLEAISGGGQFGLSFDAYGERFVCSNSNHIRHVVLSSLHLERNPRLRAAEVGADIAGDGPAAPVFRTSPPEPWRVARTRERAGLPDASRRYAPTELVPAGFFTSASGITIWRGEAIIGDVGGNLVHRKALIPRGVTFEARRPESEKSREFLTSTDNWFRPVNFAEGPDGALYILDMYRETIEHPYSIPDSLKAKLRLTSGNDRGRIWRVSLAAGLPHPRPSLSHAPPEELARLLEREGEWWRETAQRLLVERGGSGAVASLEALAAGSPLPPGRIRALWTLEGLGKLEEREISRALADPHPRVREHAVRLFEVHSRGMGLDPVLPLEADPDPRVRLALALALGGTGLEETGDPRRMPLLAALARRDGEDPWMRSAILSSSGKISGALFEELAGAPEVSRRLIRALCETVGAGGGRGEVERAIQAVRRAPCGRRETALLGLGDGLRRSGSSLRHYDLDPEIKEAGARAMDRKLALEERVVATELLAHATLSLAREFLAPLIDAREPPALQMAAVRSAASVPDPAVAPLLVEGWGRASPPARREVLEALQERAERLPHLLSAVEEGKIPAGSIDPARRPDLMGRLPEELRDRARALFAGAPEGGRQAVVDRFRSALDLPGDATRGQEVFARACAACHELDGRGHRVGPDLRASGGRPPEALLVQVLDPNRELLPGYTAYLAVTRDGRAASGLVASENAGTITLRRAEGVEESIGREGLRSLTDSGLSLMPEGLERDLSPKDLADLIAYLLLPRVIMPVGD